MWTKKLQTDKRTDTLNPINTLGRGLGGWGYKEILLITNLSIAQIDLSHFWLERKDMYNTHL